MKLRLFLSFALIVLVTVICMVYFARLGTTSEIRTYMFGGRMGGVQDLSASLQEYYQMHGSWQGVETILSGSRPGFGTGNQGMGRMMGQRVRLADLNGQLILDTSNPNPIGNLSAEEITAALPIEVDHQIVGYLVSQGGMGFTLNDETFLVGRLTRAGLIAGVFAGGFSLLLAMLLAYRLLRPIQALTSAAQKLGQGDLTQRVNPNGSDELAVLGKAFDQMADSLQQAEESRKSMTADIAHELRTPLSVQRANLEALQDGVYPLSVDNLAPILEQNYLLTRLVEDLRTLALVDAGQLELEYTPVDLVLLASQVLERFKPDADNRKIKLTFSGPPKDDPLPSLLLDPMRIEQILNNLISNALRHTPEGGTIQMEIHRVDAGAQLTLHDSGPGISDEALKFIFQRFYRADQSRSREEGGTGLGLPIARQLAEALGGTLIARNHSSGGAVFTLALPVNSNLSKRGIRKEMVSS
jgi:signal transduction histidine kinase